VKSEKRKVNVIASLLATTDKRSNLFCIIVEIASLAGLRGATRNDLKNLIIDTICPHPQEKHLTF